MTDDWSLYLVRTRSGSLYTGIATDVPRRLAEHMASGSSKGAKYLRAKGPLQLAYQKNIGSRTLALRAESAVKKLSKQKKESLVRANPGRRELLKILAIE